MQTCFLHAHSMQRLLARSFGSQHEIHVTSLHPSCLAAVASCRRQLPLRDAVAFSSVWIITGEEYLTQHTPVRSAAAPPTFLSFSPTENDSESSNQTTPIPVFVFSCLHDLPRRAERYDNFSKPSGPPASEVAAGWKEGTELHNTKPSRNPSINLPPELSNSIPHNPAIEPLN